MRKDERSAFTREDKGGQVLRTIIKSGRAGTTYIVCIRAGKCYMH